ncbi:hypothetical protein Taro_040077, partial [Colocasia esculenta]|nr:hypothetical protein [Colocasia esculenta]
WEGVHLVQCTLYFCRLRVYADRVRLPDYAGCPDDRICITSSSVTCPIHLAAGPVDSSKEFPLSVLDLLFDMFTRYMITREEDLPRARAVWESTTQTNFKKSLWEARDKAAKIAGSQDPTAWMDYGPERSQAAKCNRAAHPEKNVHTSGSVSYVTQSQKLETYDRTMADRYVDGTP